MAAIYYGPTIKRRDRWLLALTGVMFILIPVGQGTLRAYNGYSRYGPAAASSWSLPWFMVAGVAFLAWLLLMIQLVRRSQYGVLLYRNGLRFGAVERSHKHAATPLLPWEKVRGIAVELIASTKDKPPIHKATLFLEDRKIHLAEARSDWGAMANLFGPARIENLPELITRLKAHLYPRLFPSLRSSLLSGEELSFGPLAVHRQHILLKTKSSDPIPWTKVRQVTIQSGYLVVELERSPQSRSRMRVPVSKIPNLELLLKLIEEHA